MMPGAAWDYGHAGLLCAGRNLIQLRITLLAPCPERLGLSVLLQLHDVEPALRVGGVAGIAADPQRGAADAADDHPALRSRTARLGVFSIASSQSPECPTPAGAARRRCGG